MSSPAVVSSRKQSNGHAPSPTPEPPLPAIGATLEQLDVNLVDVGENVRIQPGELDELTGSIKEHGVLQPVRAIGPHADGRYRLVWGQRRLLASRAAGLERIPAIVEQLSDVAGSVDQPGAKRSIEQLVENLQRADLNPIDEAKALRQVLDADKTLTQVALAQQLGRSAPWVSNSLRLLEVAEPVQQLVAEGKLSAAHVKAIAGLTNKKSQQDLAERAVRADYSAKRLESEVAYTKQNDRNEPDRQAQIKAKTERFAKKLVKLLVTEDVPKDATIGGNGGYDTDRQLLTKLLHEAGYPKATGDYLSSPGYKPADMGELCDCTGYRFETYPSAHFERVCVNRKHVDAFQAKQESEKDQHKKELRNKAKRLTAVLELGLAGVDPTAARLAIAAIFGSNFTYHVANGKGDAWAKVAAIAVDALPHELGELIASTLIPTDQWGRTDPSAGLATVINKLSAAPAKKSKPDVAEASA